MGRPDERAFRGAGGDPPRPEGGAVILAQMRLADLILRPECQMRIQFREDYAAQLAEYLQAGGMLPPVVAFRERPGPRAILADGFHRRRAHEIARRPYI